MRSHPPALSNRLTEGSAKCPEAPTHWAAARSHVGTANILANSKGLDVTLARGYVQAVRLDRLLQRLKQGNVDNVRFDDLVALARALGFTVVRTRGSHHVFRHPQVRELLNLQSVAGRAKPYQVHQLRDLIDRYNLKLGNQP